MGPGDGGRCACSKSWKFDARKVPLCTHAVQFVAWANKVVMKKLWALIQLCLCSLHRIRNSNRMEISCIVSFVLRQIMASNFHAWPKTKDEIERLIQHLEWPVQFYFQAEVGVAKLRNRMLFLEICKEHILYPTTPAGGFSASERHRAETSTNGDWKLTVSWHKMQLLCWLSREN